MIGEPLSFPRERERLLRLTAEDLRKNYRLKTFQLRRTGEEIVLAEGEREAFAMPGNSTHISAVTGKNYAYDPAISRLYPIGEDYYYNKIPASHIIVRYFTKTNYEETFCVTDDIVYRFNGYSLMNNQNHNGGPCAALFRERVFTAKGSRLFYTKAFDGREWQASRYGAGYIDLFSDDAGEILALLPYKDKLYLMRRHGITVFRVLGDELNFKAVHLPMKCGAMIDKSAAFCGEKIGYFTERGLYLFNGASSERAENARHDEIDFSKSVKAVSCCGRYYALVTKKTGGKAVYCYDPAECYAHFIENGAVDLAAADEVFFSRGGKAYKLTEKGLSQNFSPYLTAENVAFGIGEEKMLRAVAIEGEGAYRVTITSNRGQRTVKGRAGEVIKLRSPLRGNGFSLKICVDPADAYDMRFCAVQFRLTEEKNDD